MINALKKRTYIYQIEASIATSQHRRSNENESLIFCQALPFSNKNPSQSVQKNKLICC